MLLHAQRGVCVIYTIPPKISPFQCAGTAALMRISLHHVLKEFHLKASKGLGKLGQYFFLKMT